MRMAVCIWRATDGYADEYDNLSLDGFSRNLQVPCRRPHRDVLQHHHEHR
jgi:hypothetical protein